MVVPALLLSAVVFAVDLLTPLGVSVWMPFLLVVLLALLAPGRWPVLTAAAGCSALTVLGVLWDLREPYPADQVARSVANRTLGVVIFWLTAVGGLAARRTLALERMNDRLRREVEERRRAEARIREQASLLDVARDAIAVLDLGGRVTYWNRGAERLYGWPAGEAVGRDFAGLVDRTAAADRAAAESALAASGEWAGEARHVTCNGQEVIVAARWAVVADDDGRPRARLVVNSDVTESRNLEARLRQAQRLESIGVLAGGIAHDFNNLLTPILMSVRLIGEDRPADERAGLLAAMRAGAERGADLVRKLLAFAGGGGGERVSVAVPAAVREVEAIVAYTFPKAIRVRVRADDSLPPVTADPTEFAQVLMNLCVNARDAMPDGGELGIEADPVSVPAGAAHRPATVPPGPFVRLGVSDTGCGIAPDVVDRIFDPFFTTKPPGVGTGLGLSTVLGIVRGHGGFITVASAPGAGTRFEVYWPAAAAPDPAPLPPPPPGRPSPGGLVLVADDEPPILHAARLALEGEGYRVVTAGDGVAALDVFRRHAGQVRAVVLDVTMPGLDGADTYAELRRLDPAARVLITSGLRPPDRLAEAIAAGRAGFLPKPFTADTLAAALARLPAPAED